MRKLFIVREKKEFNKLIKTGICKKNDYFVIYYKNNNLKYDRFGISVGTKIGNAVTRNKYKRKMRAILDIYIKKCNTKKDYIILLRKKALSVSFEKLEKSLFNLLIEGVNNE